MIGFVDFHKSATACCTFVKRNLIIKKTGNIQPFAFQKNYQIINYPIISYQLSNYPTFNCLIINYPIINYQLSNYQLSTKTTAFSTQVEMLFARLRISSSVHVQRIPNEIRRPITSCDLGKWRLL